MSIWVQLRFDKYGNKKVRMVSEYAATPMGKGWKNVEGYEATPIVGEYYDRYNDDFTSTPTNWAMTNYQFWDRFTVTEQEDLLDHTNKQIKWAVNWLQFNPTVDIRKQKVINAINRLETAGVIGAGRAASILDWNV